MSESTEAPLVRHDEDLDRAARGDKWRIAAIVLSFALIAAIAWVLFNANTNATNKASSEASQKFTLAQQVAAACAIKTQADDLGGLCASATQIVKEGPPGSPGLAGPPGSTGAQGPLGPKGELGPQGVQGIQGVTGLAGILGGTGAAGGPGVPGVDGLQGVAGPTGPVGPVGAAGAAGANGAAGATGAQGQSAFPFTFNFLLTDGRAVTCTLVAAATPGTCTTP